MLIAHFIFTVLAALAHLLFFAEESLFWLHPKVRKTFGLSEAEAKGMQFMAFNQGFYNLFLAAGIGAGMAFNAAGQALTGRTLIVFACASMVGAALVLSAGGRRYFTGVLVQGLPPLLALIFLALAQTQSP